jgi:hypothetical protein
MNRTLLTLSVLVLMAMIASTAFPATSVVVLAVEGMP